MFIFSKIPPIGKETNKQRKEENIQANPSNGRIYKEEVFVKIIIHKYRKEIKLKYI